MPVRVVPERCCKYLLRISVYYGEKRVNTEKTCSGFIKRERAGIMTESQKMSIYDDLVQKGEAV